MLTLTDPIKGRETAQALIELGCDVLVHQAGATDVGVVEVLRENSIPAIALAPTDTPGFYELQIGTGIYDEAITIFDIIGLVAIDGTLYNIDYAGGVAEGWVDFIFEHPELAPFEASQEIYNAIQQMFDGTSLIPYLPEETPPDWSGP